MKQPRIVTDDANTATVYRAIFDRALDAILLADDDMRFVDANPAAAELTGYSRDELLRMRVSDLSPAPLRDAIVGHWREFLQAGGQSGQFELQTKDGRTLALQYRAAAHIAPGLHVSILRDISGERHAVQARQHLETLGSVQYAVSRILATCREVDTAAPLILRAIGEGLQWPFVALWLYDEQGGALRAPHTWSAHPQMAGFDAAVRRAVVRPGERSIPATVFRTMRPLWVADITADRRFFRASAAAEAGLCCAVAVPIGGDDSPALGILELVGTVAREPDQPLIDTLFGVGHQIAEYLERVAAERAERESIAAANRLKDEFLAVVSHELRTPLNAILGWSRLLKGGQLGERGFDRAVDIIERNAQVQAQIIEDLLDVSRIVAGRLRLDVSEVNLARIAREVVDSLAPAAEAKGLDVSCRFDEDAVMSGDRDRLQQITWNLVSNAVKFTPRGGRVRVDVRRRPGLIEVVVSDTGTGIHPAMLPRVFDRFLQADSSTTRQHGGLGLGLAIVRHLVELHGGNVAAESEGPGHGSTFRIRFPVRPAHDDRSR